MKLSTKGRYAMVALADISLQPDGQLVTLSENSMVTMMEIMTYTRKEFDLVESMASQL